MGVLEVTTDEGVQLIKFSRPEKKNALNIEMYDGCIRALESGAQNDSVVLTVLKGSGDYYSSGNDFNVSNVTDMEQYVQQATALMKKFVGSLIDYPKLLIAVVNGPAIGLAATTLALCDVVFTSNKAWFQTPFSKLGLVPEACSTITFPRIMGSARAAKLLYLNEKMSAKEAETCGFVTRVYPDAVLESETSAAIREFAQLPLQSLQLSKQLVRNWDRELLHQANQVESKVLGERFQSEDFFNAMLKFRSMKSKL